jgi:hypothetical protein
VLGPNILRYYSEGKATTVYLPGSNGWPTIANSESRVPGTTEVLVGGEAVNETKAGANRSVVFQYS